MDSQIVFIRGIMNLLHEFYEKETGKSAKQFINHGTIYDAEYIHWLEKMIMSSDVKILIEDRLKKLRKTNSKNDINELHNIITGLLDELGAQREK